MSPMRVCTQCGFTYSEFLTRGLLGCPQCYACFGETLWADLLQLHPGLYQHAMPDLSQMSPERGTRASTEALEDFAQLKETLADALRGERYEEAAGLRRRIQEWETRHGSL
jgi:protein arginine kinase activator